jgi:nucleotide-binding universal stress UspA family protein
MKRSLSGPVLFCFDGSDGSLHALSEGGGVLRRGAAVVLTVWETAATELTESGAIAYAYLPDESEFDSEVEAEAHAAAGRGAILAGAQGWDARPRAENAAVSVWRTIVDVAAEIDASVIVCGSRGMSAIKRGILGSVSEALLHHSGRPMLISLERSGGPGDLVVSR